MEKIIWNDCVQKGSITYSQGEKNVLHPASYILERGSIISHSVADWLLKKLWTCRKTD